MRTLFCYFTLRCYVDLQDIIAVLLELGELQPHGSRLRRSQQLVPVAVGRHVSAES